MDKQKKHEIIREAIIKSDETLDSFMFDKFNDN